MSSLFLISDFTYLKINHIIDKLVVFSVIFVRTSEDPVLCQKPPFNVCVIIVGVCVWISLVHKKQNDLRNSRRNLPEKKKLHIDINKI